MARWIIFISDASPAITPWLAAIYFALADAVDANPLAFWMPLLNIGGVGAVLAFVLWKLEPRMRGAEAAVDRQTRMLAMFMIEMPHINAASVIQFQAMVKELDEAKRLRNDPTEK